MDDLAGDRVIELEVRFHFLYTGCLRNLVRTEELLPHVAIRTSQERGLTPVAYSTETLRVYLVSHSTLLARFPALASLVLAIFAAALLFVGAAAARRSSAALPGPSACMGMCFLRKLWAILLASCGVLATTVVIGEVVS